VIKVASEPCQPCKEYEDAQPEFAIYITKQQQVLNFLLSSLSKEMLEFVAAYLTPQEVWESLVSMIVSQSRTRVINTHMALSTTRKGNLTIAQYIRKMKAHADDMASVGKKLYNQLAYHEQRQELRGKDYSMANAMSRRRDGPPPDGGSNRGRVGKVTAATPTAMVSTTKLIELSASSVGRKGTPS
jgi:hypothetical protein